MVRIAGINQQNKSKVRHNSAISDESKSINLHSTWCLFSYKKYLSSTNVYKKTLPETNSSFTPENPHFVGRWNFLLGGQEPAVSGSVYIVITSLMIIVRIISSILPLLSSNFSRFPPWRISSHDLWIRTMDRSAFHQWPWTHSMAGTINGGDNS